MNFTAQRSVSSASFVLRTIRPRRSIQLRLRRIACTSLPADEAAALVRTLSPAEYREFRLRFLHRHQFGMRDFVEIPAQMPSVYLRHVGSRVTLFEA